METTNKLIDVGKWGIILAVVFEITTFISGSILMKEQIFDSKEQVSSSTNILYFDEIQKLKSAN